MSHFNQCSQLANLSDMQNAEARYMGIISKGGDPLQVMLDMQKSLQDRLAKDKPRTNRSVESLETCGDILAWMRAQDDYLQDETRELYTSLGGMSNGEKDASAVWKPWKARHEEMRDLPFAELSDEDKLEVYFELIDQFHFFMNKFLALGLDAEAIFKLYFLKNAENFSRQDRGY